MSWGAPTTLVAPSMTMKLGEPKLLTKTLLASGFSAIQRGLLPTGRVEVTWLVPSMTVKVLEPSFTTYTLSVIGLIAIAAGLVPAGIVGPAVCARAGPAAATMRQGRRQRAIMVRI